MGHTVSIGPIEQPPFVSADEETKPIKWLALQQGGRLQSREPRCG